VLADLRPYICLSPDCPTPLEDYVSRKKWIQHVLHNHWKSWKCTLGCGEVFDSADAARGHVTSRHAHAAADVTMVVGAGETRLSPNIASHCPLCQERVASLKDYARHVGRHQKELAVFALPKLDAGEDAEDVTAGDATDREISSGSEGSSAAETERNPELTLHSDPSTRRALERTDSLPFLQPIVANLPRSLAAMTAEGASAGPMDLPDVMAMDDEETERRGFTSAGPRSFNPFKVRVRIETAMIVDK
jgi:hypothetical protein